MKLWVLIILAAIVFFALMSALSTFVGLLFWFGVAGLVIGGVSAIVSRATGADLPRLGKVDKKQEKLIDRHADRALQELEQRVNRQ